MCLCVYTGVHFVAPSKNGYILVLYTNIQTQLAENVRKFHFFLLNLGEEGARTELTVVSG